MTTIGTSPIVSRNDVQNSTLQKHEPQTIHASEVQANARAAALTPSPSLRTASETNRLAQTQETETAASNVEEKPKTPSGDPVRGARLFIQKCGMCHTAEPEKNRTGPSLFNVFNREAGTAPGFSYSRGMKAAEHSWTETLLDKFLKNPKEVVPGTKMQFKVNKKADRQDLIAYLKETVAKDNAAEAPKTEK